MNGKLKAFVQNVVFVVTLVTFNSSAYGMAHTNTDFMQEKVGEAVYRQLKLDQFVYELEERLIPKEYKFTIGNISLVINVFLQRRIEYKTTFP